MNKHYIKIDGDFYVKIDKPVLKYKTSIYYRVDGTHLRYNGEVKRKSNKFMKSVKNVKKVEVFSNE